MYEMGEDVYYYLTLGNENYVQPAMPDGAEDGILKGLYRFRSAPRAHPTSVKLLGSGSILNEVVAAQALLDEHYGVAADVYSVTSYKALHRDGVDTERWNLLHPGEAARVPYVTETLGDEPGVVVAASDYVKVLPDMIAKWAPGTFVSLGTDGFGRSEGRAGLRDFFEVDRRWVAYAALSSLARRGELDAEVIEKARGELGIDADKPNPWYV